jgi:hypothetical protein
MKDMDKTVHRFSELFAQLGLPADVASIRSFIEAHSPLDGAVRIEEASFWTPAQARLLGELIAQDADWAEVADRLNAALRRR